ncbi:MAG: hypothetical protein OHK0039_26480 [Bacteroidia bacterium]
MESFLPNYFRPDELEALRYLQGRVLDKVLYTVWRNVADQTQPYALLEWVELYFGDGEVLALTSSEEEPRGLEIRPLNFGLEQTRVIQQFRGQVELERVDMSESPIWAGQIGSAVTAIGLVSFGEELYQNNLLHIEFESRRIEVSLNEDGLLVQVAET